MKNLIHLFLIAFALYACGGGSTSSETDSTTAQPETTASEPESVPAVAELSISGDDAMKFNKTELKVKEGQTVKLTLSHSGKLPKAAMGHNFVLLVQGANMADFGMAAMGAVDTDYIPADQADNIIAHTKLVGGGESDTIEFEAPAKGTYDFLCSFPGHSALMKGKFIVE
ncbi:MAG: azurin [Bacteroidetes bacterium]|nr:azurin [Bacteroidota bacterium]MCB0844144.1 azurin [Bacteroidota bacterium]MCB0854113.1 azurin [Bacteroidota bacterium]